MLIGHLAKETQLGSSVACPKSKNGVGEGVGAGCQDSTDEKNCPRPPDPSKGLLEFGDFGQ
jgi:hypothetical protein